MVAELSVQQVFFRDYSTYKAFNLDFLRFERLLKSLRFFGGVSIILANYGPIRYVARRVKVFIGLNLSLLCIQ